MLYVSPLKALSADIHKNLAEPRRGIVDGAAAAGLRRPEITAAVRTGDTSSAERAAMIRTPPHILVTTPESLYLLLTSGAQPRHAPHRPDGDRRRDPRGDRHPPRRASRALARAARSRSRERPLLRLGLSATQKPIEEVARWLSGTGGGPLRDRRRRACAGRSISRIEVPGSPLEAVMAHEVWDESYDRLARWSRAQDDAGVREHAALGRADRAASERTARRRSA